MFADTSDKKVSVYWCTLFCFDISRKHSLQLYNTHKHSCCRKTKENQNQNCKKKKMIKRPKGSDTEQEVLKMQKEFLMEKTKNANFQPAAKVVKLSKRKLNTFVKYFKFLSALKLHCGTF